MSAETLREAARLMRERAGGANFWEMSDGEPKRLGWWSIQELDDHMDLAHRAYIASWHPAVALAVADWLDACALVQEVAPTRTKANALAVARAYLGETS